MARGLRAYLMAAAMAGMVFSSAAAAAVIVGRRCVGYASEMGVDVCELAEVADRGSISLRFRLPRGPCRLGSFGNTLVIDCRPLCEVQTWCRARIPEGWYGPGEEVILGG